MAIKSQPYRLSLDQTQDLVALNKELAQQLNRADEMFEIIFKALKDLTARIEALE